MPTLNPRLTVTLQPSVAAQLRELSRLTGNSQSALISELLESSAPVFDRLIRVLAAAEEAKKTLSHKVKEDLEQAQGRIERQLGLVLDDFDQGTAHLLREAEAIKRRAGRGAAATGRALRADGGDAQRPARSRRASTPLSNRGVRSDPPQGRVRQAVALPAGRKGGKSS